MTEDRALGRSERKRGSGQISGDRAIVDLLIVLVTSEILQLAKASRGVSRWVSRFLMTFSCNEQAFPERFFWRQNNWYSIGKDASAFTPIRELAGHYEAAVVETPFRQKSFPETALQ